MLLALCHRQIWIPPSIPDTLTALREIKQLGFDYAELEGVSGPNIEAVYEHRFEIKRLVTEIDLKIVNFVPVIPELRELDEEKEPMVGNCLPRAWRSLRP